MKKQTYFNRPLHINNPNQGRLFIEVPNGSDCFLSGSPHIPDEQPELINWQERTVNLAQLTLDNTVEFLQGE